MKTIELKVTSLTIDIKKNNITYETGVEAGPGILVLSDNTGEKGMVIVDQFHRGGNVAILTKPFITPAKKFEVDDVIATLVLFE